RVRLSVEGRFRGEADGRLRRAYDREGSAAAVQGIEKTSIQCPSLPDSGSHPHSRADVGHLSPECTWAQRANRRASVDADSCLADDLLVLGGVSLNESGKLCR